MNSSGTRTILQRLETIPIIQSKYNIFTHVEPINKINKNLLKGSTVNNPLSNTLCAVKDNIATNDMPTTCSSSMLSNYQSPFDATVVKLLRESGTTIVGKTNMDEFAMGSLGIHSHYGPALNPLFHDVDTVSGGSSSGSAGSVTSGVVHFALGTDTGGSVRLPACYCSVLGFKGSYGRISRFGVVSFAQSLDTVGIMADNLQRVKDVFNTLDKFDKKDPTSLSEDLRNEINSISKLREKRGRAKFRIGIPKFNLSKNSVNETIRTCFIGFLDTLMKQGHEIFPVELPSMKYALPVYYTIAPSEAVSNLARYDGIRYGTRDEKEDISNESFFSSTRSKFGKEVQRRLILGNYNLISESFKNNFLKAQTLRVSLINEFDNIFSFPNVLTRNQNDDINGLDFLLSPTSVNLPKGIDEIAKEKGYDGTSSTNEYMNDLFTIPVSLAGLPALTIPAKKRAPIGIQLIGQYGDDQNVLNFAEKLAC